MPLSFGPESLSPRAPLTSDVTVTVWNTNTPASLTTPVSVDELGRVSFTVASAGHYTVAVRSDGSRYERHVFLQSDPLDLSSPGKIREALTQLYALVESGGVGGGNVDGKIITTDDWPRPDVEIFIWRDAREDQSSPPVNMAAADLWLPGMTYEAAPDTEDPSTPTGLASSAVTDTSFTVTWNASTDNVGVTGYDWRIDGGSATTVAVSPRSVSFAGRTAETEYTFEVRARDAAGNLSEYASLAVTTDAAAAPIESYSVFGASAPTGSWTWDDTATPYIVTGRGFACAAAGARAIGGRAWIPADGIGSMPEEATFYLFGPDANIGSVPVQTTVVSTAGVESDSWVEALFDVPQAISTGEVWMIGVRFTGGSDAGKYSFGTETRPNSNEVNSNGPLGADLVWVEQTGDTIGLSSNYKIGTDSVNSPAEQTHSYGIDILVDLEG